MVPTSCYLLHGHGVAAIGSLTHIPRLYLYSNSVIALPMMIALTNLDDLYLPEHIRNTNYYKASLSDTVKPFAQF